MTPTAASPSEEEAGHRRFEAVFRHAGIGLAVVDMEGHPVEINPRLEAMLGYSASELSTMVFTDVTHPDDAGLDWELFGELIRGERDRYDLEKRYIRKDGEVLWGKLTVSLIRDADGSPTHAIGMVEDVTERRRTEQELRAAEERFRTLVEQLPVVVYLNEPGQAPKSRYVSPAYESLLGYTPAERLADQELWVKMLHPDDRERVLDQVRTSEETGEPFIAEYRLIAKDGHVVWVHEEATILLDAAGAPMYWQGVLLDITEKRRAEAELEAITDDLRRANTRRMEMLGRLIDAQEQERRRIASDLHDDSIQKLTAIGIRLESLGKRHPAVVDDAAFEPIMDAIRRSIASLRTLLFELRPPALDHGLVEAVRAFVEELAADQEGGPRFDVVGSIRTEPAEHLQLALYRVVREAIINAGKHAHASRVTITIEEPADGFVANVADDGVGFDVRDGAHMDLRHVGLRDMRERIELAGGTFRVTSRPRVGTTVRVWLPSHDEGASRVDEPRGRPAPVDRPRTVET